MEARGEQEGDLQGYRNPGKKNYDNLENVQAGEVVSFEVHLDGRSYHVPGLLRKKSW